MLNLAVSPEREQLLRFISANPAVLYGLELRDGNFIPVWVSGDVERMLGYTVEQCLNEENRWLSHVHPDDKADVLSQQPSI